MGTTSQATSSPPASALPKTSDADTPDRRQPLPAKAIDELWLRMGCRYGHTWVSQYGDEPAGMEAALWREDLAGLTADQVRDGMRADVRRGSEWPPSSAVFRALCLGIPEFAVVARELRPGCPKLSPFGRAMWSTLDVWRYQQANAQQQERMARDAYAVVCDLVQRGEPLPREPEALLEREPQPKHKPAPPEVAKRHLDEIAERLRGAV